MAKAAPKRDLLVLAFDLIAEHGWRRFSPAALARASRLPLSEVYRELPDRRALLTALGRRLDLAMLAAGADELADLSPRERVFELVMRRLDAMAPFKRGLASLGREAPGDLMTAAQGLSNLCRATSWLVEVADAPLPPAAHGAARLAMAAIYVRVFNIWLKDDTADLARTLAELDRRLQQAESVARFLCGRRAPGPAPAAAG